MSDFLTHSLVVLLVFASYFVTGCNRSKTEPVSHFKGEDVAISCEELEKAGFLGLNAARLHLWLTTERLYLMSNVDDALACFGQDGNVLYSYAHSGQGPGEFQGPCAIASAGSSGVQILDTGKKALFVFTPELTFLQETRLAVGGDCNDMVRVSDGYIAVGRFDGHLLAKLDADLNPTGTFVQFPNESPIPQYPWMVFTCRHARIDTMGRVVVSEGIATSEPCWLEVYDKGIEHPPFRVEWPNNHTQTYESLSAKRDYYSVKALGIIGNSILIQAVYKQSLDSDEEIELILLSATGEIVESRSLPSRPLVSNGFLDASRVYYLDEQENLAFVEVKE